jgi:hypothetical protein
VGCLSRLPKPYRLQGVFIITAFLSLLEEFESISYVLSLLALIMFVIALIYAIKLYMFVIKGTVTD